MKLSRLTSLHSADGYTGADLPHFVDKYVNGLAPLLTCADLSSILVETATLNVARTSKSSTSQSSSLGSTPGMRRTSQRLSRASGTGSCALAEPSTLTSSSVCSSSLRLSSSWRTNSTLSSGAPHPFVACPIATATTDLGRRHSCRKPRHLYDSPSEDHLRYMKYAARTTEQNEKAQGLYGGGHTGA